MYMIYVPNNKAHLHVQSLHVKQHKDPSSWQADLIKYNKKICIAGLVHSAFLFLIKVEL